MLLRSSRPRPGLSIGNKIATHERVGYHADKATWGRSRALSSHKVWAQLQTPGRADVQDAVGAQGELRRRHHRRRGPRVGGGVLPRARPRRDGRRGVGEGVHRRRRHRAQHHDHPLQLPDARGREVLRRERPAVRRTCRRTSTSTCSTRSAATSPWPTPTPSMRTMRWRAEVNKHLGVDSEVVGPEDVEKACPPIDLTCGGHAPILGALYHPPGAIARHDAVAWGYGRGADRRGVEIHQNTEVTGIDVRDGRVVGVRTNRGYVAHRRRCSRPSPAGRRGITDMVGVRTPLIDPSAAGLRDRAAEALAGPDHRLGQPAHLRQPVLARRTGHGRRRSTPTSCISTRSTLDFVGGARGAHARFVPVPVGRQDPARLGRPVRT